MQLHVIDTGFFKLDGGAMYGVVPKSLWSRHTPPDADNLCTWAMRCLLIEAGDRLVLVDTGLGDKQSEKFFSYFKPHGEASLLGSLQAKGFGPEDVTDVILTHLHFDHCGGAVVRTASGQLVPQFPNATYWSHADHWQWASNPNDREKASFLSENFAPLQAAGQLDFVTESTTLLDGRISFMTVNGHTEQMLIPHIRYRGRTLVFMADLMPSVSHLPMPWVMGYDIRPLDTLREKAAFYEQALANNYVLFFEHDAQNECCTLIETEKGVRAGEIFNLSELSA